MDEGLIASDIIRSPLPFFGTVLCFLRGATGFFLSFFFAAGVTSKVKGSFVGGVDLMQPKTRLIEKRREKTWWASRRTDGRLDGKALLTIPTTYCCHRGWVGCVGGCIVGILCHTLGLCMLLDCAGLGGGGGGVQHSLDGKWRG